MDHIELRRNIWYAVLTIPSDVRATLGKLRFVKSLRTPDRRAAVKLARPIVAAWKAQVMQARGDPGALNGFAEEVRAWREQLAALSGEERSDIELVLSDHVERVEQAEGFEAAKRYYDLATGRATATSEHFEDWRAQLHLAQKTIDQMLKDVRLLIDAFPVLEGINPAGVKRWLDRLTEQGASASTLKRIVGAGGNYWRYLIAIEAVAFGREPFRGILAYTKKGATVGGSKREAFSNDDVVRLWRGATKKDGKGRQVADLIILGAYSGARIEELCSLKLKDVGQVSFKVIDAKTEAGIREVPIHSELLPVIDRLRATSKDGYLLSGLTFNKYGDRSNAIGKRFGRLKDDLGFSRRYVFHSLRKSFITQLENAGVPENVTADIVGHDKPRITYGGYSGGNSLAVKAAAVAKIDYPF